MNKKELINSIKRRVAENEDVKREAYKEALERINDYLEIKPSAKLMVVPAPLIKGLFFWDDRQEIIAEMLKRDGFKVKKESKVVSGTRQEPMYYIYFWGGINGI